MGRVGIEYEDVANAAHQLQGKELNLTVDNIRSVLGTGSKSTIAAHLRAWKSQQGIIQASDTTIPAELLSLVKGLWERIRETANNQISEYRNEFSTEVKKIQEQLSQSQQQNTFLESQIHELEEKLHQQTELAEQLQDRLIVEHQDKVKMVERAAAFESQQHNSRAEIERLHKLLRQVQNNLEHYQAATQELRQEQALLLERQRSEYEQKINQCQQNITDITKEKLQYQTECKHLDKLYHALQEDLQEANRQQQDTQKQYASLSIAHQSLQREQQQITQQYHQQAEKLEQKTQVAIKLKTELDINTDKISSLHQALAKADDKIKALRHDYEFVSQEKATLAGQIKQLQVVIPASP